MPCYVSRIEFPTRVLIKTRGVLSAHVPRTNILRMYIPGDDGVTQDTRRNPYDGGKCWEMARNGKTSRRVSMMTAARKFWVIGYCWWDDEVSPRAKRRSIDVLEKVFSMGYKIHFIGRSALFAFFLLHSHSLSITPRCIRWNPLVNYLFPYCQRRCLDRAGKVFPISLAAARRTSCI